MTNRIQVNRLGSPALGFRGNPVVFKFISGDTC